MFRRIVLSILAGSAVLLFAIQFVPYRVRNPAVLQEPDWDSPQTRVLAERACFDCHSNQTRTPWYGNIAPVAWIVRSHVDEGREYLNLSEMQRPQPEAHESAEVLLEGEMPPAYYTFLHPEARLTDAEKRQLADGLDATLGGHAGEEDD